MSSGGSRCGEVLPLLEAKDFLGLARAAHHLIERLAALGAPNKVPAYAREGRVRVSHLSETDERSVASALKGALTSIYLRFSTLRASVRRKTASAALAAVLGSANITPQQQANPAAQRVDGMLHRKRACDTSLYYGRCD
jgi:hypothetical protein